MRDLHEQTRETTDRDLYFNPASSEPCGDRILRLEEKALKGQVGVPTRMVALDVVRVVVLHFVVDVVALRRSVPLPDQPPMHPMQQL